MSKTRWRKPIAFVTTASAQSTLYAASLEVVTTFTPPALGIAMGTLSHQDVTAKPAIGYLSYTFGTAAQTIAVTHGFSDTIKGWFVVNKTASYGVWCSNLSATAVATTLSLKAGGTMTAKIACILG